MKIIHLEPFQNKGMARIAIRFDYDHRLIEKIRSLPGRKWDTEDKVWHIPYSGEKLNALKYYLSGRDIVIDTSAFDDHVALKRITDFSKPGNISTLATEHERHLQRFSSWLRTKWYSVHTIDTYTGFIRQFLVYYRERKVENITHEDILEFNHFKIINNNYSISYQRQLVSALKLFFQQIACKKLDINQLERPRKERKLPTIFSREEVRKIISSIRNEKHRLIISMIYSAGLRISEALNLVPSDIDSGRMLIHLRTAKGRKDRFVPLSVRLLKELRNYYIRYRPETYLFEGKPGKKYSPTSCRMILKRAMSQAGIRKRASLHTLRHSYATHLFESGTDIRYIQVLLGHESSRTTEIYTHVSQKKLENIKSPFDELGT